MKRLLVWIIAAHLPAPLALAVTSAFYINNGIVNIMAPPQTPPVIDATNFVNNGRFNITNLNFTAINSLPWPFETWNTLNYSNRNIMNGDSGWRFDFFDSSTSLNKMSANFVNANLVNETNSVIFGNHYILVSATNVHNRGALITSGPGLISLQGKNVDLTRSVVAAVGSESNAIAGVLDNYWGIDTNGFLGATFNPSFVFSSPMLATTLQDIFYMIFVNQIALTNGFTTYELITQTGVTNFNVDVLFLANTNPAISTEVRFNNFFIGAQKAVQWQSVLTNRATGLPTTNTIYLADSFPLFAFPALVQTPKPFFPYDIYAAATFHPDNYTIIHSFPGFTNLQLMTPVVLDPTIFAGLSFPTIVESTWGANITAQPFSFDPSVVGATYTNVPGRIEITADKVLNLTRTRIDGESYLKLAATNHFVGSTNAQIIAPFSDINLRTTNRSMTIANLLTPTVPRMCGTIEVWSGAWTNVNPFVAPLPVLLSYNVTIVDSRLAQQASSQIQDCTLTATNLFVSDVLNVLRTFLLPVTQRLTVTTNALNAPTPAGEINLTSGDLFWSDSLPRLQYLTNFGKITSANTIYLLGARQPPWFSATFDEPYQALVSHGLIAAQGNSLWANYFEFSGTNSSGVGPIDLRAVTAVLTNGGFVASSADISIAAASLFVSNQLFVAGHSLILNVTNYLDDGSLASNSADFITNKNIWIVGDGIQLPQLPPQASLLGTTVTSTAPAYVAVPELWSGRDYGCTPRGYTNNAALGRLVLSGGYESLFEFIPADPTRSNALYVDSLEFLDFTADLNIDTSGNLPGVQIDPNMKVYYAQALANGVSIAERINGANGGGFCWVSNYNFGFWSSTTNFGGYIPSLCPGPHTSQVLSDGTVVRLNAPLVQSQTITLDSDGDGIPNGCDTTPLGPNPYGKFLPESLALSVTFTKQPVAAALVSWNTVPYSTNTLYAASSAQATNWQVVTNFVLGSVGGRVTVTDPLKSSGLRFYRARVAAP